MVWQMNKTEWKHWLDQDDQENEYYSNLAKEIHKELKLWAMTNVHHIKASLRVDFSDCGFIDLEPYFDEITPIISKNESNLKFIFRSSIVVTIENATLRLFDLIFTDKMENYIEQQLWLEDKEDLESFKEDMINNLNDVILHKGE